MTIILGSQGFSRILGKDYFLSVDYIKPWKRLKCYPRTKSEQTFFKY